MLISVFHFDIKLVGCTDDELRMAQQWSGKRILGLMKQFKE